MIYQSYDKFLQYVNDAVNKAGEFKGQSDSLEVDLDLNIMKKLFDDFKTAASKKLKGQGIKEGQVMSFEQMDKIYSGLKNAIDLYEKLVGDIEDPMADFTDDLGSDIVNYNKQGPLSSPPEIKNIENLSQSQMLTLASMARQAIDLAQSDVGANVTDILAAEEFVKKLDVAIAMGTGE